jgi:vacuolar protein sorting-associated protein 35
LAAYAAREAENEDPEETKRQEEAAARRLAEKVKIQKARARESGTAFSSPPPEVGADNTWGASPTSPVAEKHYIPDGVTDAETTTDPEKVDKGKEKEGSPVRKFRGVPEDVQLFEVFWKQVVELIKVRYVLLYLIPI